MPSYRLILRADAAAAPQTIEFEDLARAISYVEQLGDFLQAELWSGKEYLATVHHSRTTGKVWTVGQPESTQKKKGGPEGPPSRRT